MEGEMLAALQQVTTAQRAERRAWRSLGAERVRRQTASNAPPRASVVSLTGHRRVCACVCGYRCTQGSSDVTLWSSRTKQTTPLQCSFTDPTFLTWARAGPYVRPARSLRHRAHVLLPGPALRRMAWASRGRRGLALCRIALELRDSRASGRLVAARLLFPRSSAVLPARRVEG
jgi:hypothetical protein